MDQKYEKLEYPRFSWTGATWSWYTAILGVVLALYFGFVPKMPLKNSLEIVLFIFLAPVMLTVAWHFVRVASVGYKRIQQFDVLVKHIQLLSDRLASAQQTIIDLLQERQNRKKYSIAYCYIYKDQPVMVLCKKRGATVPVESKVTVVDTELNDVIGHFRVINQDDDHYLCRQDGYIDAVWLGFIMERGSQQSMVSPTAVAFITSIGDENG
ncbi:MAG: hypothetical protein ABFD54_04210 [Armatimonadota bacterium]|nr:hypothetical protein [bacterium]